MSEQEPILSPEKNADDNDRALRPESLAEFIGQAEVRSNLKVFVESAKRRGEAMDHTLFMVRQGLGKQPWHRL